MTGERKIRSIVKGLSWRFIGVLNALVVTFIFLPDFKQSLKIAIAANVTGMILYYFHERVWNKSSWKRELNK